ncbi:MAG: rRNA (cytidine-2'-O-)-methyltransferase, partial [Sphingopyxis sp.]|nr:rRNA (cytidine-2'-O-)-methyltransferase [Sphingopyxis sp.]
RAAIALGCVEWVPASLGDSSAGSRGAPAKGEIVTVAGPPGGRVAEEADDAPTDAALRSAMADKPVAQAAKAVAKQYGLDRHEVYARALALKEQA